MDNKEIVKRLEAISGSVDHEISQLRKEIDTLTTKIQTLMDTKPPIYKLTDDIGKDIGKDSDGD